MRPIAAHPEFTAPARIRTPDLALLWQGAAPYFHSLLRIMAAFIFLQTGTAKLFALPAAIIPGGGTAPVFSLIGMAGTLETVGGALLLVGLWVRPVAFVLAGEMAFAYFLRHAPHSFWPVINQGQPAVLFAFIWLYFSAAGAGVWSADAMLRSRRGSGTA